jgi:hypothetical protein
MSQTRRWLCIFYGLLALVALFATWSQNLQPAHVSYLEDLKASPASRSFTVDIGFFLLAGTGLMVTEARRLGVRFVWLYVILGFLIAISVTFPIFLIAREMRLAKVETFSPNVSLKPSDIIVLALTTIAVGAMSVFILT